MGLVVCKKFVEVLGGKIKLKSQFGKGTTVSFIIPTLSDRRSDDNLLENLKSSIEPTLLEMFIVAQGNPKNVIEVLQSQL